MSEKAVERRMWANKALSEYSNRKASERKEKINAGKKLFKKIKFW